ncbi:MAG: hypothetical protein E5X67_35870 [Mesorhizobium sp.]|uniref:hypothetical protein n=1 Tax=Mesorhizobium sp. TaxID=1871066 RepID=UPI0012051B7B|nr:hypothetical protein [Mesorhizobium sp.]TIP22799.1 MAG: hypothetical protein E5X67_35870 [Mesorhizobium sp.]
MPNTTVRAAAEGMPDVNRRRLLNLAGAGLALAATSAIAGKASAAPIDAAPAEHPDAALFRLDQEMEEAYSQMNRASEVCSKVSRKCEKLYPPRPPAWEDPDMPDHLHEMNLDRRIRDEMPEPIRAWLKERREQRAANGALQEAFSAKWAEINREGGLDAAEDAFNVRSNELWELGLRIFATPANTLEGMVVKLRAADRMDLQSFADENEGFLSIAADIRRLASGGTA